ncbi:hypothetical protein K488DRAFT_89683 [Vararia minispora EC-137]|uniref:Uncharacterized protein n=1 Tax=Vararia minispora EC-137 TaxID=1314806 RepID=A0ACB8Q9Z3_9AGAM|nr:hypothetical protein K488DRAFT_89683 [Vararia minispora EC-137]
MTAASDSQQATIARILKNFGSSEPLTDFWQPLANARFLADTNTDLTAIDIELDALASVLRAGRERRNGMVAASRLPAEVLATIFEFVKQEAYGEYEDIGDKEREGNVTPEEEPRLRIMGWINFSQVCQRWRRVSVRVLATPIRGSVVALSFPHIWREIKFSHTGPSWAGEMLRRSKETPLHVEIGSGQHANPYFSHVDVEKFTSTLLAGQARRLKTFTIFGEDILYLMTLLLAQPSFPVLRFLHIENTDAAAVPSLSFPLLAERTPELRELCAIGVMLLGIPSASLEHLTYFDLQMPEAALLGPLYGWQLLDVFGCMPALQHLYITDVYPDSDPPPGMQPAKLPSPLETLTLAARQYPKELFRFSTMLAHPTAFRDFEFLHAVEPDVLGALLARHVGPACPPRSLYLEVDHAADKIIFSASFTPWPPSTDGNTPTPLNDISVTVAHVDVHADAFLPAVCLRDVVDLTFLDDQDSAWARWHELIAARAARHLRVIGRACRSLFRVLAAHADAFPAADALSIIEMAERAPHLGERMLEGADELVEALEIRRAHGAPIRDLKVPDRLVEGEWVAPLRKIVDKLGGSRPRFY